MLTSRPAAVDETYFDELRAREFTRLALNRHAYLDYTGSALYGDSQLRACQARLADGLFGNPHADHVPSRASMAIIAAARRRVLNFLDAPAEDYLVCFAASTSAAIKLVAESFAFGPDRTCVLTADNHNSVNGIREYARRRGGRIRYVGLTPDLHLDDPTTILDEEGRLGGGLFAFPAQSNFSGVEHSLSLVAGAQARGFDVLLDIAAFAPSHPFSLRRCPADFVALSFYKLFGYPTGIGALVARREALARLARPWFAGGTVTYASVAHDTHELRSFEEGFEDGTPNFLGIAALDAGFDVLADADIPRLHAHVARLTAMFLDELRMLRHANGAPLARVYGPASMTDRGSLVTFNVTDRHGQPVPFSVFETRAAQAGVSIRGGCFCNPGAAEAAFGFDTTRTAQCLESLRGSFTIERFASCLGPGIAVGAVRASFGLANNAEDIRRAIDVAASFRE
jgi:selenocysteine lyase/cysteine desulfurase